MKAVKGKKHAALTPTMWGKLRTDLQRKYGRLLANCLGTTGTSPACFVFNFLDPDGDSGRCGNRTIAGGV